MKQHNPPPNITSFNLQTPRLGLFINFYFKNIKTNKFDILKHMNQMFKLSISNHSDVKVAESAMKLE